MAADLLCVERMQDRLAESDPAIFKDQRVLDNLLEAEMRSMPRCNYFHQLQPKLRPFMRKTVTAWMLEVIQRISVEVCEEERCEPQVFPMACNLLDRFLCERPGVESNQLQMLGCVCLLVASKYRQCTPFQVDRLSYFTDHSVTAEQMRQFEIVVLGRLGWDISCVTGFDLVDHVLERVTWSRERPNVRVHARTMVDLCCTEPALVRKRPSMVASGCVLAAARGLRVDDSEALPSVCRLLRCRPDDVIRAADYVEALVREETLKVQMQLGIPSASGGPPSKHSGAFDEQNLDRQPETPTEVQDIFF